MNWRKVPPILTGGDSVLNTPMNRFTKARIVSDPRMSTIQVFNSTHPALAPQGLAALAAVVVPTFRAPSALLRCV